MKNVSQRNAPGAISAIAFDVSPVRPSVVGGLVGVSAPMKTPSAVLGFHAHTRRNVGEGRAASETPTSLHDVTCIHPSFFGRFSVCRPFSKVAMSGQYEQKSCTNQW